jgi:hypothetical protein
VRRLRSNEGDSRTGMEEKLHCSTLYGFLKVTFSFTNEVNKNVK